MKADALVDQPRYHHRRFALFSRHETVYGFVVPRCYEVMDKFERKRVSRLLGENLSVHGANDDVSRRPCTIYRR